MKAVHSRSLGPGRAGLRSAGLRPLLLSGVERVDCPIFRQDLHCESGSNFRGGRIQYLP